MISAHLPQPVDLPLRVLVGHRPPAPITRHIDQIVGDNLTDIDFGFIAGAYRGQDADVLHILDPKTVLRGTTDGERIASALALVEQLEQQGTALVQTIFSGRPHGDPALNILDEATKAFILLDETTSSPAPERTMVIPHGHFREKFLGYPRSEKHPGRLLCISRSRLTRSTEEMVKVFTVLDTPGASLRIVGDIASDLYKVIDKATKRGSGTISTRPEKDLSDGEFIREVCAAEFVFLPRIETLTDLATLFIVLSLNRPIIVPADQHIQTLSEETGRGWLLQYDGTLTAEKVDLAITEHRQATDSEMPNLDGRDTGTTVSEYSGVYYRAASTSSGR